jgi:hypothetical protein
VKPKQRVFRSALLPVLLLVPCCSPAQTTSSGYWQGENSPVSGQDTSGADMPAPSSTGSASGSDSGATPAQAPEAGTWHPQQSSAPPVEDAAVPSVVGEAAAATPWPSASDASVAPSSDSGSSSSSSLYPPTTETAQDFCTEYQMYCGFGGSQRYTDMNACVMNYNSNPGQDGCYVYHLHAAIAGTATLCTSPPTQMCFDIHCPHATGLGGYCS